VQTTVRALGHARASLRFLRSGSLKRLPVDLITNEFAFSFAAEGWHYLRALVAEYDRDSDIRLEDTIFWRFFQDERVRSVHYLNDVLYLHDPARQTGDGDFRFYLGTYPWGDHVSGGPWGIHFDRVEGARTRDIYGDSRNPWYDPGARPPLEIEWRETIRTFDSIRKGYRPWLHGSLPQVTLLVRRDGDFRAVRYNGQHRFARLAHLGRRKISVLVPSASSITAELASWPTASTAPKLVTERDVVVHENDVEKWYYVKRGLCSVEQALEIFDAFFELDGSERAAALGLPRGY
jgi:hypothetical protein